MDAYLADYKENVTFLKGVIIGSMAQKCPQRIAIGCVKHNMKEHS